MLTVPHLHERDINGSPGSTRSQVEGTRSPEQSNTISCIISVERCVTQEWLYIRGQDKIIVIIWLRVFSLRGEMKERGV